MVTIPPPTAIEMAPFDLVGPVPTGTTLLEASAGTGKTFAVAALVTRFVAEGLATLDEMLVITFGRAASQELRERVRDALVDAERALRDPTAPPTARNEVLDHLLAANAGELALRHARVRDALADFDAATIATTHQFCQLVLRSLGVAGDTDAGGDSGRVTRRPGCRGGRRSLPRAVRAGRRQAVLLPHRRAGPGP